MTFVFIFNKVQCMIEMVSTLYTYVLGDFNANISSDSIILTELEDFRDINNVCSLKNIYFYLILLLANNIVNLLFIGRVIMPWTYRICKNVVLDLLISTSKDPN